MTLPTPKAGHTHHVVLEYGNGASTIGLMLPDTKLYTKQPYNPFVPQSRVGEETIKDFSISTKWEMFNDLSGGTGHIVEKKVEDRTYDFAQGAGCSASTDLGAPLFTAKKGRVLPPPADTGADATANYKQFIEFKSRWYGLTSDTAGLVKRYIGSAQFTAANSEYLSKADHATISTGDIDFAIAGWVYFDTVPASDVIFFNKTDEYMIGKDASNNIYFKSGATDVNTFSATTVAASTWYFVYAEHDAANNTVKISVNNGTIDSMAETVTPADTANALALGSATGGGNYLNGRMANWGLWKRVLTGAEITSLYNSGSGKAYASLTTAEKVSLVSFWDLDELSGNRSDEVGSMTLTDNNTVTDNDGIPAVRGTISGTVETLTASGKQLFTDGSKLYCTQGASNAVRSSTDGLTWANESYNADYICAREGGVISYIAGATFTPGGSEGYAAQTIGLSGSTANCCIFYKGAVFIGKPEGMFLWAQGKVEAKFPTAEFQDSSNFTLSCVHRGLLYFNVKNMAYYTSGQSYVNVYPEDINGFTTLTSFTPTYGPLLIGCKMQSRNYLHMFWGPDTPGLNPLWSDADGTKPVVAAGATSLFDSTGIRIYLSQTTTGTRYLSMGLNYTPATYHTASDKESYLNLTVHSSGFKTIPKWYYQAVVSCLSPVSTTKVQVWYSVDGGTWTQCTDSAGTVVTLSMSTANQGCFFPLNTTGTNLQLRLYVWSTSSSSVAEITHVTVVGDVMTKPRYQIAFPVRADKTVYGLLPNAVDSGINIRAAIKTAAEQGYPSKLCDPEGNWHLVLFKPPSPLETYVAMEDPKGIAPMNPELIIQLNFVEIDALTSAGAFNAWTAG